MNKLLIIRHAKSSNPINITDFDRPLHKQGLLDLMKITSDLKNMGVKPELFIHSPALRAKNTALILAEELGGQTELRAESDIYYGTVTDIIQIIRSTPEKCQTLALVGHNPTLHEFCTQISNARTFNFELLTSTVVCFSFSQAWSQLRNHSARFEWIITT